MFSRSKRIFGIAVLSLAAATVVAVPAHADSGPTSSTWSQFQILRQLRSPLCLPTGGLGLGLPLVDKLLPELTSCR
ncbi:hypothetical protein FH608_029540 [Nonomuraea phyllanthi]|uniref:Uncharacterized protein n=1 Tax=Nonomuraea phyllanthi TaxID=2219224 RepID=A0A5C4W1P1_9ACTN|nr:hypothetical protein [Nonomuraea phyllanthi]KAB8191410.1 hypothetical protein FH608_029540 [Nonomuraea phyllanthi]QFY13263.1 hypothetical protein GBF35_47810 [Nonomuraea phyllanthi]